MTSGLYAARIISGMGMGSLCSTANMSLAEIVSIPRPVDQVETTLAESPCVGSSGDQRSTRILVRYRHGSGPSMLQLLRPWGVPARCLKQAPIPDCLVRPMHLPGRLDRCQLLGVRVPSM